MRMLLHSQMTCLIKQKGQALVELATFGTILLLCLGVLIQYGMHANYQQSLQMQAFRKAMRAAYYKSGPAASTSIQMIHDKAIPDPRDPWGFAERSGIGAGASVIWDSNMQGIYIEDYSDTPEISDLPRSYIEINDTLGLTEADLSDSGINNVDAARFTQTGAFRTGRYRDCSRGDAVCGNSIEVIFESTSSDRETYKREYTGESYWFWDVRVRKAEKGAKAYAYIRTDSGLKQRVDSADVDGDGQVETILAVLGNESCTGDDLDCGTLRRIKFLDLQAGDIDIEYTTVHPWEVNKDRDNDGQLIDDQQGLALDYSIVQSNDNTMVRTEGGTGSGAWVRTETNFSGSAYQETTHVIDTRQATNTYHTQFKPRPFTWRASK